jgi:hypothetical protein
MSNIKLFRKIGFYEAIDFRNATRLACPTEELVMKEALIGSALTAKVARWATNWSK